MDVYTCPGGVGKDSAQSAIRWYPGRRHTVLAVFREMYGQILSDYSTLPDPSKMSFARVAHHYDLLRPQLREATKPKSD